MDFPGKRYTMRSAILLLFLGALGGCEGSAVRTGRAQPGQPADSELTRTGDTVAAANTGAEFEAPRLIPGLRAQLSALSDTGAGMTEGNIAAYRNLASDVVTAMHADLNRVGSPDVERIRAMGDSVVRLVGGGAGEAPGESRERITSSIQIMERLIQQYQDAVRAAQR
jgi:hypothetical protein